ncbi:HAD-IIIC family phosphatase [Echinicola shivajiensis]|uniref:HAD-IIIC family phosphatase n=1 Tax=Echinicola shivajiensis TaxID=1035916 RepID=UPI001BFCCF94|nr:HAD-IIIC family phosphatase [Echinicola shivajiensis]
MNFIDQKIKLVIWDLDETFWKGTLSEEGISPIQANIDLVKTLTDRGIINSIVSKNDPNQAEEKLRDLGIWDYFIFPAIAWSPKGTQIKDIITKCQLRDNNVLFLDDNHSNLEEAKFFNPNINAFYPDFIEKIESHPSFQGKDDRQHSRLKQYKILEKKHEASLEHDSNIDFLRTSEIKIELIYDVQNHIDRVQELLERTNQLNFTKARLSVAETKALLDSPDNTSVLIHVKDNFGDYGIVGFYSYNPKDHFLDHFVFSCRILNLGIPQYIYAKLNFPELEIVEEVAEQLDNSTPDWIEEIITESGISQSISSRENTNKLKLIFRGNCDYKQTLFYVASNLELKEEVNYVSSNMPIYPSNSQTLLNNLFLTEQEKNLFTRADYIPFIDSHYFDSNIFSSSYNCLIYQINTDCTQEIYRHKKTNILLPLGKSDENICDKKNHPNIISTLEKRGVSSINEASLEKFGEEFEHIGKLSPEDFIQNMEKICGNLPKNTHVIFINASESLNRHATNKKYNDRYKIINMALDTFIHSHPEYHLLDVRNMVTNPNQFAPTGHHFNRETYKDIASGLLSILSDIFQESIKAKISPTAVFISNLKLQYTHFKTFVRNGIWKKIKNASINL